MTNEQLVRDHDFKSSYKTGDYIKAFFPRMIHNPSVNDSVQIIREFLFPQKKQTPCRLQGDRVN